MKVIISDKYISFEEELKQIINNIDRSGELLVEGSRNMIKTIELSNGTLINIKRFKKPNLFNQLIYRFFRKSKAQRSYNYATYLEKNGIGTPEAIAFFEFPGLVLFKESYYICKHISYDYLYRDVVAYENHPSKWKDILNEFTHFTFLMHENDVEFLDHSPGNTLIKEVDGTYQFYLVDLNRMKIGELDKQKRIKNFAKLTHREDVIRMMSTEYAQLSGFDFNEVNQLMTYFTKKFQYKWHSKQHRKKQIKKIFKS